MAGVSVTPAGSGGNFVQLAQRLAGAGKGMTKMGPPKGGYWNRPMTGRPRPVGEPPRPRGVGGPTKGNPPNTPRTRPVGEPPLKPPRAAGSYSGNYSS
jgi:hypothetical protein